MNDHASAVTGFLSDPAHRRLYQTVVAIVGITVVGCVALVCLAPTKYCNYLVPAILGATLILLVLIARRYAKVVTALIEKHDLICASCGGPTIPRPDELVLRSTVDAFGTDVCYNCDADLTAI